MVRKEVEKVNFNKILVLHDYRGYLASSYMQKSKKIDILLLKRELIKRNFDVEIRSLHDLTFPDNYEGEYVLYPSSEDHGLFYKSFIEDILLRLEMDGAVLLPKFEYFRAHHNKVFMELYRTKLSKEYQTIKSVFLYGVENLNKILEKEKMEYPLVVKCAEGSGSAGVRLVQNEQELLKKIYQMGKITFENYCCTKKDKIRHFLGRVIRKILKTGRVEQPKPREKLVIQTFIPNLQCDYKILVFGEKYYLLKRYIRKGEFRASGSGNFEFPSQFTDVEKKILDFAFGAYEQLNAPMLSIDVAFDGVRCHMLEFQCVNFGPYTLQFSSAYYKKVNGIWEKIDGQSVLEEEIANAVKYYVDKSIRG